MEQDLISVTERIVKDTMAKLAEKQATFNTYKRRPRIPSTNSEKTVSRFVGRRIKFENDNVFFEGENRYDPELWSIETQYKKIVDYCVNQNIVY